ncbi:lysophospholipid acyltransferase family protein [Marmoricola sp. RAF53]|uniref:lysophospholipid acyltransferase family protein n=1 Tax=Marmoricola sp. RAF53 TaxID=3233059 RepID=UPI003F9687FB
MRDFSYPVVIAVAKTWFKLGDVRITMTGTENIPETGGVLLAINHLSFVDYLMAGYPGVERGRLTRFMAKKEIFDHPVGGPVMRSFHHISIDRGDGQAGIDAAHRYLDAGELVGIFPEGTISRSLELQPLKTGAVRIAADAGVPLVPVVLWGTQRFLTKGKPVDLKRHKTVLIEVGEPMHPTPADNANAVTAELQRRMEGMLDRLITAYPAEEQPAGSWWLPASYGGSAPTPDEAAAMYVEERRLRALKKAEKRAKKAKK